MSSKKKNVNLIAIGSFYIGKTLFFLTLILTTMPIPVPNLKETHPEFIERCMSNDSMLDEYPDTSQRLGVCYTSWTSEIKKVK